MDAPNARSMPMNGRREMSFRAPETDTFTLLDVAATTLAAGPLLPIASRPMCA
jgi:hypothetical protein